MSEANAHYERGAAAYKAGRFQDAVDAFLAADRLVPSGVLSFNIARAHDRNGTPLQALAFYRDYLRREPGAKNADDVGRRIAALETELLARGRPILTVLSEPPNAAVEAGGRVQGATPWAAQLSPGVHRVRVTREGHADGVRDVELKAATAVELRIPMTPAAPPTVPAVPSPAPPQPVNAVPILAEPPAEPPRGARFGAWPFVALGAGGAALLTSGLVELSRRSAEEEARSAPTQLAYADAYETAENRQTVARVLAATGGALLVGGGILLVLDGSRAHEPRRLATVSWTGDTCLGTFATRF